MAKTDQKGLYSFIPGDKEAVAEFVRTYSDPLVRFAYS